MLNEFILDDLNTFEDIDISDVDYDESTSDSSEIYDINEGADESVFEGYNDFDSFTSDNHILTMDVDSNSVDVSHGHHTEHNNHKSQISFTGRYKCSKCDCEAFIGYGTYCGNFHCGHSWNSHNFWK